MDVAGNDFQECSENRIFSKDQGLPRDFVFR